MIILVFGVRRVMNVRKCMNVITVNVEKKLKVNTF